ncbi:hypothetical protein DFS33DRAFT_1384838 [Desarmillaria ectypa]|nr:hypothetical protein DFS33DRAFT_1384838 [Desarmillaria ectypa]
MTGTCSIYLSELDVLACSLCGHMYCLACLDVHISDHTTIQEGANTSWCPVFRKEFSLGAFWENQMTTSVPPLKHSILYYNTHSSSNMFPSNFDHTS